MRKQLSEKLKEAVASVIPVTLIVLLLQIITPMPTNMLIAFLIGAVMLVLGMGLFSLGADIAMMPMGERIGAHIIKSKHYLVLIPAVFMIGALITVAEPDLQVLADQFETLNRWTVILTVAAGVGSFLVLALVRIIKKIQLTQILLALYVLVFAVAGTMAIDNGTFIPVAFDSGGVTTGPMTVPFILAMGVGVSNIRSDRRAEADSFGLVALCSVGPILSVLLLGFFSPGSDAVADLSRASFADSTQVGRAFLSAIPEYMAEPATALLPVVTVFLLFQIILIRMSRRSLAKILIGIFYTYAGLVLFLTGVNVGFSSLGAQLGGAIVSSGAKYFLIPLSALIGWFIISAEPAVAVLEKQIETVSAGAIPGRAIKFSLSAAIAAAMGISALRVLTGISIMWFLVPGYAVALVFSFFVPDIYTAIAFDSGGVASGPMTATFMLQFMMGASTAAGGSVLRDAFGIVAMVAMMPLISIQTVGFIYERKAKREAEPEIVYGDLEIVELWGESA